MPHSLGKRRHSEVPFHSPIHSCSVAAIPWSGGVVIALAVAARLPSPAPLSPLTGVMCGLLIAMFVGATCMRIRGKQSELLTPQSLSGECLLLSAPNRCRSQTCELRWTIPSPNVSHLQMLSSCSNNLKGKIRAAKMELAAAASNVRKIGNHLRVSHTPAIGFPLLIQSCG